MNLCRRCAVCPEWGPNQRSEWYCICWSGTGDGAANLARSLDKAVTGVGRCQRCRTLTEQDVCATCLNEKRDSQLLCVVETPADILAIEQAGNYQG